MLLIKRSKTKKKQRMFTLAAAYDYVQAHVVRYGPFYLDSPD